MFINLYNKMFTVFLAAVSPDMDDTRQELTFVLENAGIKSIDGKGLPADKIDLALQSADCSIHVLGKSDIYTHDGDGYNTPAGVQFRAAKNLCSDSFKMLVWNPSGDDSNASSYINNIRREIIENTFYTDKPSPIIFVEDIRNIMNNPSRLDSDNSEL